MHAGIDSNTSTATIGNKHQLTEEGSTGTAVCADSSFMEKQIGTAEIRTRETVLITL